MESQKWSDCFSVIRDFDDAAVFFCRNAETKRLQERLHRPRPLHRFVPVVGWSGSGKSSLVRAGLLPKLARRTEWILAPVIYPDQSPLESRWFTVTGLCMPSNSDSLTEPNGFC